MGRPARSGRLRKLPQRPRVTAEQFRDARVFGGLSREAAANFLGVALRTVGMWETGKARPAYAAFRLLRVYRHGDLIHPGWDGFRLVGGRLVTPEGKGFTPADMSWQSLLVRRAEMFSTLNARRQQPRTEVAGLSSAEPPTVPRPVVYLRPAPAKMTVPGVCSTGLVYSSTSHTRKGAFGIPPAFELVVAGGGW